MKTFQQYCHLKESLEGGVDEFVNVGDDDENFNVEFTVKEIISKAQQYPIHNIPISILIPMIQNREEDPSQTKERIKNADLQYPIIVVANDNNKIFAVLDGTHRVQKAAALKMNSIKGHVIPKSDMSEFATEPSQYSKYYNPNNK